MAHVARTWLGGGHGPQLDCELQVPGRAILMLQQLQCGLCTCPHDAPAVDMHAACGNHRAAR